MSEVIVKSKMGTFSIPDPIDAKQTFDVFQPYVLTEAEGHYQQTIISRPLGADYAVVKLVGATVGYDYNTEHTEVIEDIDATKDEYAIRERDNIKKLGVPTK